MKIPLETIKNTQNDPEVNSSHTACVDLFKRRGTMTQDEFNREIAYIALRYGFDEIRFKELPFRPQAMVDYDSMSKQEKESVKPEFWRQENIYSYLMTCKRIKTDNQSNKQWLLNLLDWIPKDDFDNKQKILKRLVEFGYSPELANIAKEFNGEMF